MKVLSFDPGYDRLGVAVIEVNLDRQQELLFSDCFITDRELSAEERLFDLGKRVVKVVKDFQPELIALEKLFFNQNVTTALRVAEVRGVIIFLAKQADCQVVEYSPQEIKVATTGYGRSDKKAVYLMVKKLLKNVPEKALDDEYDAVAIGITALAHYRD